MRETYSARKAREAKRDRIHSFADEVADNTASGEMVRVEPTGEDWPRLRFGAPVSVHRCDCGMAMAPLPQFHKRFGILSLWMCVTCDLPGVVAMCLEIDRRAANSQPGSQ